MSIMPTDKPDESTTVLYEDVEFDIELPDDFFSLRNLRSGR